MIVIHDWDPGWPEEFRAIRTALQEALGPLALRIDHIGSTSVPGLAAKDVIDVQVTVEALAPDVTGRLVRAGWRHCAEITEDHVPRGADAAAASWAKLVFREPAGVRRANVHVRVEGKANQRYPLLFRDWLRAHPVSAGSMASIKRAIAARHADDVEAYYDIKDPVCDLVWVAAREWAEATGWSPDAPDRDDDAALHRPRWPQRPFAFGHPPWMLDDFTERLRGLVPRVRALLEGVDEETARRRHEGSWSIAQNVGHLADVEDLWQERLEDLRRGREVYAPADPARFRRAAERHQTRTLTEIVAELAGRRERLTAALDEASPALRRAHAFHERLQCRMRLSDCAQFYAEHDDHHLLRVRFLLRLFGPGRGAEGAT
jgi:GrpB-like predicted nucleotidyltransferase (UPF0157 family)/uncharacterized damage-inducible protein DinB